VIPVLAQDRVNTGRKALSSHFDVAAADGRKATRLTPWSADAWLLRGDAAVGLGEFAVARRYYRRAASEDPQNWLTWARLANVTTGRAQAELLARVRRLHPGQG